MYWPPVIQAVTAAAAVVLAAGIRWLAMQRAAVAGMPGADMLDPVMVADTEVATTAAVDRSMTVAIAIMVTAAPVSAFRLSAV